jgi:flagellar basal-body rod protein FlgC
MDYLASFAISAAGMSVERLRLDTATTNIANMHTSAGKGVPLYQPMRVLLEAPTAQPGSATALGAPHVQGLVATPTPPRLVYDPGHPDADSKGFVSYAGVDHLQEMTTVMSALRAYEANVAALNAAKGMAARALEIGGQ